jgi:hypothetical protein
MGAGAPSEAEMRQMLAQMRDAPAEQILVEVVNALLQAVQVKLGRPDARLLLDVVAAVTESTRGRADEQLVNQVADAVAQLRLAQVEAEGEGASHGTAAGEVDASPVAGPAAPAAPQPATQPAAPPGSQGGAQSGSRLWVPGA